MRHYSASSLITISVIILVPWLGGCSEFLHPQGYGYVFNIGGPNAITQWTLDQKDSGRISDGFAALATIARDNEYSWQFQWPWDADLAIAGCEQIYQKLSTDWPGYTGIYFEKEPKTEAERSSRRELDICNMYYSLMVNIPSTRSMKLFFKICPDREKYPERYACWEKYRKLANMTPEEEKKYR